MLKILKKSKKLIDTDEHLFYVARNTTPYQRLVWLRKAFELWRYVKKHRGEAGYIK